MIIVVVIFFAFVIRSALGPARIRRRIFHPAVLRSADVQFRRRLSRHLARRAHLHRLRRHLRLFRGSPKPAAQYSAGHGAGLRDHRRAFRARGLRRAARLGRQAVSEGHGRIGVSARGPAGRRIFSLSSAEFHDPDRERRLGHGRATGRRAAALRHGAQRRAAARVFRRHRAEAGAFR